MNNPHHSIRVVSKRTGLSPHVIRVWEKRYQAVEPSRTDTNRRLYSDAEIERLALLREVAGSGHNIGAIARLPTERLRELALQVAPAETTLPARERAGKPDHDVVLERCIAAIKAFDSKGLEDALKQGSTQLGSQGLLQRVIAPLAQSVGELWRDGTITSAHEHFASAIMRTFLGHAAKPFAGTDHAPVIIVATPTGQLHELGALLAGSVAANLGWHVTYLGASLPAAEIAGAARQNRARAVALSLVYPEDDPRLEGELRMLRSLLPGEIPILVGGRAMNAYRLGVENIGALAINDLAQLSRTLDELRRPAAHFTR
jgi:MerR family transcriptional regulator, light-induced transcriptional regulator